MAANMLSAYYSCGCDSAALFSGLEIEKEPSFEKHLNRMRKIYKSRHDHMLQQLRCHFPDTLLDISADHAGLYMILHYHGSLTDSEIQERAAASHIRIRSLKGYYAALPADYQPAFLLGFANPDTNQIRDGIALLAEKVLIPS